MKVFVGYDSREDEAYRVCEYSIKKHEPTAEVIPLKLSNIPEFTRDIDSSCSTEFSFTRFLVPYLSNYKGISLYADCDFIFTESIAPLFQSQYPVAVVKHNYIPKSKFKMDGRIQSVYPRKNWSSLIVFNCEHPKNSVLNPGLINTASGLYLHQFKWLRDVEIGELDPAWNHLAGWSKTVNPKGIHFTEGGPWFDAYRNCEFADLWLKYKAELEGTL